MRGLIFPNWNLHMDRLYMQNAFTWLYIVMLSSLSSCSENKPATAEEISRQSFRTEIKDTDGGRLAEILVYPARDSGVIQIGTIRIFIEDMKISGEYRTEISLDPVSGLQKPVETGGGPKDGELRVVFDKSGIHGCFGPANFELTHSAIHFEKREVKFKDGRKNVWISGDGKVLKVNNFAGD